MLNRLPITLEQKIIKRKQFFYLIIIYSVDEILKERIKDEDYIKNEYMTADTLNQIKKD